VRSQRIALAVALAAIFGCADVAASATASDSGGAGVPATRPIVLQRGDRGPAVRRVQRRLHIAVTGRFGWTMQRAVERFQLRVGLDETGRVDTPTRRAMGLRPFTSSEVYRARRRLPLILRLIARCESHGNPRAISSSGRYRGKYQFSYRTWHSLGGTGDPALAPVRVQDRLALRLYRRRGTRPWPRCAVIARRAMSSS
jgi:hypothetical protein